MTERDTQEMRNNVGQRIGLGWETSAPPHFAAEAGIRGEDVQSRPTFWDRVCKQEVASLSHEEESATAPPARCDGISPPKAAAKVNALPKAKASALPVDEKQQPVSAFFDSVGRSVSTHPRPEASAEATPTAPPSAYVQTAWTLNRGGEYCFVKGR